MKSKGYFEVEYPWWMRVVENIASRLWFWVKSRKWWYERRLKLRAYEDAGRNWCEWAWPPDMAEWNRLRFRFFGFRRKGRARKAEVNP